MRKLRLLLVMGFILTLAFSVRAIEAIDVFKLAVHYPQDTAAWFTVRTDDDVIAELDGVLDLIKDGVPFVPRSISVPELLDDATQDVFGSFEEGEGETFATAIRPWLGDSAAIGITSIEALISAEGDADAARQILFSVEITNRAAFLDTLGGLTQRYNVPVETSENGDFTILVIEDDTTPTYIAVNDDVMLMTFAEDALPLDGLETSLLDNERFTTLRDRLPAPSYNIALYLDQEQIQRANLNQIPGAVPLLLRDFAEANGQQMVGFTILDERTLTIDVTQQTDVFPLLQELGIEIEYVVDSVDLAFAENIPGDAPIVIHSTDLGPSFLLFFDIIRQLSDLVEEQGGLGDLIAQIPDSGLSADEQAALNAFEFKGIIGFFNAGFAGLTARNLEREILPWMDGDFATFIRILPGINEEVPILPDTAFMIDSDSATGGAADFVTALIESADVYDTPHTIEQIVGNDALVFSILELLSPDTPIEEPRTDFIFTSKDEMFIFGTREAVRDSLLGDGTLAGSDAYQAASAYFLPETQQVYYIGFQPFVDLINQMVEEGFIRSRPAQQARQGARVIELFESATITAVADDTGASTVRLTLTLSEQE